MQVDQVPEEKVSRILRDWGEVNFLELFAVLAVGIGLVMAVRWLMPRLAERVPDRFRLWLLPWEPILRVATLLFMFGYSAALIIHPTAENLLAIFGALAVALGFAFKDYASSLIAGVVALFERPYRNGDWVRVDDVYGEVRSLDLRTVQIVTPDDTVVSVPHGKMWTTAIHNDNSGHRELMVVADFYLEPAHDGQAVQGKLYDVALASPYTCLDKPIMVVAAEEPWGTHYRLKAYPIDGRDQFLFVTDLTLRAKAVFQKLGVQPAVAAALASGTSS